MKVNKYVKYYNLRKANRLRNYYAELELSEGRRLLGRKLCTSQVIRYVSRTTRVHSDAKFCVASKARDRKFASLNPIVGDLWAVISQSHGQKLKNILVKVSKIDAI